MSSGRPANRRLLLVDDNRSIFEDFRRILQPQHPAASIDSAAAALFGLELAPAPFEGEPFELDYAPQGAEACDKAAAARAEGRPYAVAFVDMRMPPGWDGVTTIRKLWEIDAEIQVVICTAYSDRSWNEIHAQLTSRDRWLVVKKPFDKIEVLQLAQALTEKWNLARLSQLHLSTLEERVNLRTEQLRQAVRIKNEFLANVTHELLTPMNGLLGMLTLVSDGPLQPEQADCLEDARASAERLNDLLGQIIAFNQAEAGTLEIEAQPFAPGALLEEAAACYRPRAVQKGLDLRVEVAPGVPPVARAPIAVLRRILMALLDNAVKFTDRGRVTLAAGTEGGRLAFRITNTGAGMTEAELGWVELPFAQVDGSLKRRHSGIGLGLPLAKRLAASLGGDILLRSTPGVGTTATLLVPVGRIAETGPLGS